MNTILEYATKIRRELHQYPEIGFELPKTLALVRRELEVMGIPYTEKYGKSSIVGTINPETRIAVHNVRMDIDEGCMPVAVNVFVQFVLDHMNGIALEEVKL